tara:strand:+ start:295 stop:450 length:156 start_codon:yes stop_codon:yes gene_type:complete
LGLVDGLVITHTGVIQLVLEPITQIISSITVIENITSDVAPVVMSGGFFLP